MIGYWRSAEVLFDIEMLAGDAVAASAVAEEAYAKLLERDDRWPYLCAGEDGAECVGLRRIDQCGGLR